MPENQIDHIEPTEPTTEPVEPEAQNLEHEEAQQGSSEESTDEADEAVNPNAEAAKWRKKLRATESERDALAQRVEAYQRAEVETYAAHLQKPEAIWKAGLELKDLLDDDGNIDPEKTTAAVEAAATDLGLSTRPRAPRPHPAQMGTNAAPNGENVEDALARVIRGGHA